MPEAFVFGPFRLLVTRRELMAHGVPVPVGQRAFEILLLLVSRHGELVTKDELMTAVWPGIVVEENNIQVHVSALRKVLAKAGDAKAKPGGAAEDASKDSDTPAATAQDKTPADESSDDVPWPLSPGAQP